MKQEIQNLYRSIAGLQENSCDCELPGGDTDCCKDLGACCTKTGTWPGGPTAPPGSWVCRDGVTPKACRENGGRTGGFGSRCIPTQGNDKSCPMTAGAHNVWTCCGPDGQCLIPAAYANTSKFKCECKRRGGICKSGGADHQGSCAACEGIAG